MRGTIKDAYPLPNIKMCLDCLSSAKMFSTINLQNAYLQLEVAHEDRHKTIFILYVVLPSMRNMLSTFQRCKELGFCGVQWNILLVYLDDIIMASNFDDHLERL